MYSYTPAPKRLKHRKRKRFRVWHLLLILVLVFLIVYPFWEATQLRVEETELKISNLPSFLKNVEILFVSDFHHKGSMEGSRAEEVVTRINNLNPDLVILGGDYSNSTQGAIDFFEQLPAIWARMGVYAVLGEKDTNQPELVNQLVGMMVSRGIIPLVDTVETVKVGQSSIRIAGASEASYSTTGVSEVASMVQEDDFVIFVSHSPDVIPDMQSARGADGSSHWYDLALFGHTHGGQVNLFGFTPFSELRLTKAADRYAQGWLEENRAYLLTTNGIGTVVLPVRVGAMPQIHLIRLKSR